MNPLLGKPKIDVKSLSPEEQRLFRLYGKLPSRSDHFAKHLKERKYFDSGDYAMSKAGKGDGVDTGSVGRQHPVPEDIPHLSSPVNNGANGGNGSASGSVAGLPGQSGPGPVSGSLGGGNVGIGITGAQSLSPPLQHHGSMQAGSPVKESSLLQRETSVDDVQDEEEEDDVEGKAKAPKKGPANIPIRS